MKSLWNKFLILIGLRKKESKKPKYPTNTPAPIKTDELDYSAPFPDVSHWESVDFSMFKGEFLITKASEGASYIDPTLEPIIYNCMKHNINLGFYHFFRCDSNIESQVDNFIDAVGLMTLKNSFCLPIVDYETAKGQDAKDLKKSLHKLKKFIKLLNKRTGVKCRIYTGDYMMKYLDFDDSFLELCKAPWIARYSNTMPKNLGPWGKIWAWQFSDSFSFMGIGECDGNYFIDYND